MCVCVSCHFPKLFSKLDLTLFRGLFLFILHQNKGRVGGWVGGIFFYHKSIASLNIVSNIVTMNLLLCFTS